MKKETIIFLRGVGVGLIVAAAFFYVTFFSIRHTESMFIKDKVIIEKAENLGMVFPNEGDERVIKEDE